MGKHRRVFGGIAAIALVLLSYIVYSYINNEQTPARVSLEFPDDLEIGEEISAPLKLSSSKVMNAAELYFSFPKELVEVITIDTTESIYDLWITNSPKYDNTQGTLSFEGGLPTPGFKGNDSLIATVVFRAKKAGVGTIVINEDKSRVLANDGLGTSIESSFSPVILNIK